MKLAEALINRGTLQSKLDELQTRLNNNAIIQEGELPAENPQDLMNQVNSTLKQLKELILKINITNSKTVNDGKTMTELLAERDCLRLEISIYRSFLNSASSTGYRARGSEIKIISTIPVADLQSNLDQKSKSLRELEMKIQEINWTTDITE